MFFTIISGVYTLIFVALVSLPYKGKAVDYGRLDKDRNEYYEAVGWDENNIPTSAELKRLGLYDVNIKT